MSLNCYETLVIVKPTLTEEETAKQIDALKEQVVELGGEVAGVKDMALRRLAYEIDKNPRGYYAVVYHKSPGSSIAEIERKLRYNEDILRFLTIRYVTKKEISEFEKQVAACNKANEEASSEA